MAICDLWSGLSITQTSRSRDLMPVALHVFDWLFCVSVRAFLLYNHIMGPVADFGGGDLLGSVCLGVWKYTQLITRLVRRK